MGIEIVGKVIRVTKKRECERVAKMSMGEVV